MAIFIHANEEVPLVPINNEFVEVQCSICKLSSIYYILYIRCPVYFIQIIRKCRLKKVCVAVSFISVYSKLIILSGNQAFMTNLNDSFQTNLRCMFVKNYHFHVYLSNNRVCVCERLTL